ncbi:hypothetical protein E4Z66_03445 [Aliishimia ponticola]|uniref:PA14 domain-containing protein n=1 Tax=Aliishimia ponticola TaxID=2499833 RepID=A0A4S4NG65_9RHOB|nr:LamG-like jellyroll fold domain-containing protein [Aliishimia ponticola]THH38636.1 hypothetical protein E4Z66_03445 [Aliishimia ponticola]
MSVTSSSTFVSSVPGLAPTVAASAVTGIPLEGTGLVGYAYSDGESIYNISRLNQLIAAGDPKAHIAVSELAFATGDTDATLKEFLGDNGTVTSGNEDMVVGPSGLLVMGYVYIPAGVHTVSIRSDDGFDLNLGGVDFSDYTSARGVGETSVTAEFEGGLYAMQLRYFETGGAKALAMEIDGFVVDQSAFYQSIWDFTDPPPDVPLVDVADYHPSETLDTLTRDDPETLTGDAGVDRINALGGDDVVDGRAGDDHLLGGYGDDRLDGGDGDDVLDGGYGSDLLIGGAGNDLLVSRSDAGEQKVGQRTVIDETRPDGGQINPEFDKLYGYEHQPLVGDDILVGGAGMDTFLIAPQINGTQESIEKHIRSDGTIRWAGVAGENDYQHDHWVDSFGFDLIADYNAQEDHIAVIGHTVNVAVEHVDYDNDGVMESIITAVSKQHGAGGAHDRDLVGVVFVEGDLVDVDAIKTDAGVTYGVVEGYADIAEAILQVGETKTLTEGGTDYHGYDYREAGEVDVAPEGDAADLMDNPFWDEAQDYITGPTEAEDVVLTRDPFTPLGFEDAEGQTITGTNGAETLGPVSEPEPDGLPGALGFWSLDYTGTGSYEDGRGELGPVKAYTLYENQAVLRTWDAANGPRDGVKALKFDGESDFAYLAHDSAFQVTQGTIALWVRADNLDSTGAILTKDALGNGDGGHFRLLQLKDGGLYLRFAPGDGGSNRSWKIEEPVLKEGVWTHLAVNFTEDGVTVYKDGKALSDDLWVPSEGDVASPGIYKEAYMLGNEEPWILGADQRVTEINETAQAFATDDEDLDDAFEGAMAEFGIWGGFDAQDALTTAEIKELMKNGPGTALTNPSGPQAMVASDDVIKGWGGDDIIDGGAGDDYLKGGGGDDTITGGYGDDRLLGGDGDDILDGGRGSDYVMGGDGDDIMISGSDVGEDRAGQLVLYEMGVDQPIRPYPDPSIDDALLKLVDWIDQPLYADDIFLGGAGADHMAVRTYINGKKDAILDNVMTDGRMIHWHGVAGENAQVHDHWVDGIGIDIFGDFNADEDTISVIGHTTNIEITYDTVDTDADGIDDSVLSLIRLYSQQGSNGGAHDEDELGILAVIGDLVTEDMVETDPGAHLGIVQTIDDLQEALAPSDDPSSVARPGDLFGYDDRDVEGRPLTTDPMAWSVNPFMDSASGSFAWNPGSGQNVLAQVNSHGGGSFNGLTVMEMAHMAGEQQSAGTYVLTFSANEPGAGHQALLSKDFSGYGDGGHLTIWIDDYGYLRTRLQSTDGDAYLRYNTKIEAGREYDIAFAYGQDGVSLFVDGDLVSQNTDFVADMLGNDGSTMIGASTRYRTESANNLEWLFDGEITNVSVLNTDISTSQAILLASSDNDLRTLGIAGAVQSEDGAWVGSAGGDFISGTHGDDEITALGGDDTVQAGDGDDVIDAGAGADMVDGGDGSDWISYASDDYGVSVYLTHGFSRSVEGDDVLISVENVIGSDGIDRLIGDSGDNILMGGADDDILSGKGGNDTFDGGAGDDYMRGEDGVDTMSGGNGSDVLLGLGGSDILDGGSGADYIYGGRDADEIYGGSGNDNLRGNLGGDQIHGGDGADDIRGGGNGDALYGGAGDDFIMGEGGTDIIEGGAGDDMLFGGYGGGSNDGQRDVFRFASSADGAGGFDRIRDFENGTDVIDVSAFGFSAFSEVAALASDTGSAMRIDFGGGDVIYIDYFSQSLFDAGDVIFA